MPETKIDPKVARKVLAECISDLDARGDTTAAHVLRKYTDRTYPRRMVGPWTDSLQIRARVVLTPNDVMREWSDGSTNSISCGEDIIAALREGLKEEE